MSIYELETERYFVSLGMREGKSGGFFKGIGEALSHAHPSNSRVIKKTWPKEWKRYLEEGKTIHEKENED